MNTTKTIQSRRDLDYAKYQLNTLIALFNYDNAEAMIGLNKTRALCSIDCVLETLEDIKGKIERGEYR